MFLQSLYVHNYKSIRQVEFSPTPLAALVGPNASGKSNFVDAFDFLREVYTHGLEVAIARKGGYENIAHRKQRRSRAAIAFKISMRASATESSPFVRRRVKPTDVDKPLVISHEFSFKAVGGTIRADYKVEREKYSVFVEQKNKSLEWIIDIRRDLRNRVHIDMNKEARLVKSMKAELDFYRQLFEEAEIIDAQSLLLGGRRFGFMFSDLFVTAIQTFNVFRLTPNATRGAGVPTPNPEMSVEGNNLPALVDWLQRDHPKLWKIVLDGMRDIVPTISDVSVQYLHTKTLGLFFGEEGFARPWSADDVSDGTIQALAILVASVDPRSSLLVIEEPENSVHPWIIRFLIERLRIVSEFKTVLVTTHSPVLVDLLQPNELWVADRSSGETSIQNITLIEPSIEDIWLKGGGRLSEFLDSGFIPQAVPGGVQ